MGQQIRRDFPARLGHIGIPFRSTNNGLVAVLFWLELRPPADQPSAAPGQVFLRTPRFARGGWAHNRTGRPRPASGLLALGAIDGCRPPPALLQGADRPAGLAAARRAAGLFAKSPGESRGLFGVGMVALDE